MSPQNTGRATSGRTTEPKHAPRAKRTPFVLLILGLMLGGMCLLLALNTASAANEVARHDLSANDQNAAAQLVELENEVQASAAPANLAAAAAALGMVPAGDPGFLEIGKHGEVKVLGSAAPASIEPVVIPHPAPTATRTKAAKHSAGKPAKHATKKSAKKNTKHDPNTPAKRGATSTAAPKSSSTTTTSTETSSPKGSSSTAAPPASPTPTPTPETTLPGGNR